MKYLLIWLMPMLWIPVSEAVEWQNYFWRPDSAGSFTASLVTIDDNLNSDISTIRFPAYFSGQPMSVAALDCSGYSENGHGQATYWLQVPSGWVNDELTGLRYRLTIQNWNRPSNNSSYPGWDTRISQLGRSYPPGGCWRMGEIAGITMPAGLNTAARVQVEISRASAVPGSYSMPIKYRWMFEEHKQSQEGLTGSTLHQNAATFMALNTPLWTNNAVPVVVNSKCTLSSYSNINLDHKKMTPVESVLNKTRPHNVTLSCTSGASVKILLSGNNRVSGKTANFTKCGDSGSCELTFNGDKFNETMTVLNNKNIAITSTYHPNSGVSKGGAFSGSGILTILID